MSAMMGDVCLGLGLTETLIEGSSGLKHRNLGRRRVWDMRWARECERNEHRNRGFERRRVVVDGRTAAQGGLAAPCRRKAALGRHRLGRGQSAGAGSV